MLDDGGREAGFMTSPIDSHQTAVAIDQQQVRPARVEIERLSPQALQVDEHRHVVRDSLFQLLDDPLVGRWRVRGDLGDEDRLEIFKVLAQLSSPRPEVAEPFGVHHHDHHDATPVGRQYVGLSVLVSELDILKARKRRLRLREKAQQQEGVAENRRHSVSQVRRVTVAVRHRSNQLTGRQGMIPSEISRRSIVSHSPISRLAFSFAACWLGSIGAALGRPALDDLSWLEGRWVGSAGDVVMEEIWTAPRGGVMLGLHRDVAPDRPAFFEYLRIEQREGNVVYVASPRGVGSTEFTMISSGAAEVVFENLEHDFPQRIIYRRHGNLLVARVEGEIEGTLRAREWEWRLQD